MTEKSSNTIIKEKDSIGGFTMKRILILCMACIVLFSGVVSAKVSKGKDSFTEESYVSSYINPKLYFSAMHFTKRISQNQKTYSLSLSLIRMRNSVLGNAPIEIKIDNYPVDTLKDYRYRLTGPDSYGVEYNSVLDVKFPSELAEKIKDAKKVAIRYEDVKGMRWPYTLPEATLSEWKEVINSTEWDILQAIEAKKKEAK